MPLRQGYYVKGARRRHRPQKTLGQVFPAKPNPPKKPRNPPKKKEH